VNESHVDVAAGRRLDRLAGRVAAAALRALGATWRIRSEGENPLDTRPGAQLGAFWHRDILVTAYLYRDRGFSVPISRSRDGEIIAVGLARLGYSISPRGSSSRGGAAALRSLVQLVRSRVTVSLQLDGPRGPARRAKLGMIALARSTGIAITPVAISARPAFRFASWDGTLLPLPFARVVCHYGRPIAVPADTNPDEEEERRLQLERELNRLTDELDARLGFADGNRPVDSNQPD
jgi:lysophospholipid acyltransferase (LPLAT)-like uncharacterized protein